MKSGKYAKLGNRTGRPGYRTQAGFRLRAIRNIWRAKTNLTNSKVKS